MRKYTRIPVLGSVLAMGLVLSLSGCAGQSASDQSTGSSASGSAAQTEEAEQEVFPSFSGSDLDGNAVESSVLFSQNKVTVVNFWFSGCSACVDELPALNVLNNKLVKMGGELIAINTDTLDGSKGSIETAQKILKDNEAAFRNIRFENEGEIGDFVGSVAAYPTTYVVDSAGNIVGDPILGDLENAENLKRLEDSIARAVEG